MKIAHREFMSDENRYVAYFVYCPACERAHRFIVENEADSEHVWAFNFDWEAPTFHPSLLVEGSVWDGEKFVPDICHSFVEAGVWKFQGDCTHGMANQNVPMVDFPENYRV